MNELRKIHVVLGWQTMLREKMCNKGMEAKWSNMNDKEKIKKNGNFKVNGNCGRFVIKFWKEQIGLVLSNKLVKNSLNTPYTKEKSK